jgi:DNA-binding response OmpR family regulator
VLLVEDDALVRGLAARILKTRGYRVLEAADVGQALTLEAAADGPIDLLLTDVMLPRGSGPELASKLSQRRRALKVLYMSGYTEETKADHGLLNAANYVQKPLTPESLLAKVREALDAR